VRSETVNRALAGLRLGGGEHDVLAAADDRAASRLDDPAADSAFVGADEATVGRMTLLTEWAKVGQQHFARCAEIWEVDELVTDDELEAEAAGAELLRT
jgi:hypothetical protein